MKNRMKAPSVSVAVLSCLLAGGFSGSANAQQPGFNDIVWYQIDSYCSFMRADHQFSFDDPGSWRWIAFSNFPSADEEPLDRLFMKINGSLREFTLAEERETDGVPQRIYKTATAPVITVEMQLFAGEKGYESTAYSGVLIEEASGAAVDFAGDCGV